MFGGPINMAPFGALVKSCGVIYWLLVLCTWASTLWKPRRWWLKLSLGRHGLALMQLPVAALRSDINGMKQ